MKKLKLLELFCGAGSFSYNFTKNKLNHELVGFSDIRNSALKLFCEFTGENIENNLGDVLNINAKGMDIDILTFGSPCQSFTRAGKNEGATKEGKSKSSLMWQAVRIIEESKPKIVIWENVPDAVNKKHLPNFMNYIEEMEYQGYITNWKILKSNELGSAQKRNRLFAISILKEYYNKDFKFLEDFKIQKNINEYININDYHEEVDEKIQKSLILGIENNKYKIRNGTKQGYALADNLDIIDTSFYNSKTRRGRVQYNACPTILRSKNISFLYNGKLYYLTPKEYYLLQEFDEKDYYKVENCNFKNNEYYDVIGGLINQKHLDVISKSLINYFNWN